MGFCLLLFVIIMIVIISYIYVYIYIYIYIYICCIYITNATFLIPVLYDLLFFLLLKLLIKKIPDTLLKLYSKGEIWKSSSFLHILLVLLLAGMAVWYPVSREGLSSWWLEWVWWSVCWIMLEAGLSVQSDGLEAFKSALNCSFRTTNSHTVLQPLRLSLSLCVCVCVCQVSCFIQYVSILPHKHTLPAEIIDIRH